jgi:hypothetical protein
MIEYYFETTWRINAPLQDVWEAVYHSEDWPNWWKGVTEVQVLETGTDGVGGLRRITWQSFLPYALVINVRSTRVVPLQLLDGDISGELVGTGKWTLSQEQDISVVRFEERVRTTKRWMRLLAPLARPIFRWNHHMVMKWGGECLAKKLGATLVSYEDK